jgi:transposase
MLAIDGTGYSSSYSSEYYKVRTKKRRTFVLSIATVDTDKLFIVSQHSRKGMGENTWFRPLVSRAAKIVDITHVLGDKAYDCEVNHEFVHQQIGSRCVVPINKRRGKMVHGYYRKRLHRCFPEHLYHRRSLVETVFSMLKRRFGSFLQSRSLAQQNREVGLLSVVYNVYRYVSMKSCYIIWMISTGPNAYKRNPDIFLRLP